MTDEELRKLDAQIAIEIMGFVPREVRPRGCVETVTVYSGNPVFTDGLWSKVDLIHYCSPLRYSTDIAAAWQVVEKITENPLWDFFLAVRPHLATAHFHDGNAVDFEEMDESVPVAICLAALKAVRAGKPQGATP